MSELLANIRSIKLYAWENAFIRWISTVRNEEELKMLRKIGIVTVCVWLSYLVWVHSRSAPVIEHVSLDWYPM